MFSAVLSGMTFWATGLGRRLLPSIRLFGLLGARLSSFFVSSFLGYPSLLLFSAIFFWGLELFRSRSLKKALLFFLYSTLLSLDFSAMAGMTSTPYSDFWSGAIGRMNAELVTNVLGPVGG